MHEWQSLSHVKWECKYHVVIIPKYRRKVLYGRMRAQVGAILRELCRQKGDRTFGRTLYAGPHSHVLEHSAQVQRGAHDRVPEREERRSHPPRIVEGATDERSALLGGRLLREHGGLG